MLPHDLFKVSEGRPMHYICWWLNCYYLKSFIGSRKFADVGISNALFAEKTSIQFKTSPAYPITRMLSIWSNWKMRSRQYRKSFTFYYICFYSIFEYNSRNISDRVDQQDSHLRKPSNCPPFLRNAKKWKLNWNSSWNQSPQLETNWKNFKKKTIWKWQNWFQSLNYLLQKRRKMLSVYHWLQRQQRLLSRFHSRLQFNPDHHTFSSWKCPTKMDRWVKFEFVQHRNFTRNLFKSWENFATNHQRISRLTLTR